MTRSLTLAEPALIPWLANLSAANAEKGEAVLADYSQNLVMKTRQSVEKGDTANAVRITVDYLVRKGMFDESPEPLRNLWMRNSRELEAIFTSEEGLSTPDRKQICGLDTPMLLLSGENSAASCQLAVAELETLLKEKRKELFGATHAMWIEQPQQCRKIVLEFLRET